MNGGTEGINHTTVKNLDYADDICFMGHDLEIMRRLRVIAKKPMRLIW